MPSSASLVRVSRNRISNRETRTTLRHFDHSTGDAVEEESLRSQSKDLLGNKYRAEVGATVHVWGPEPLTALTIADYTGIRYPRVQEELKRLEAAGLLSQVDQPGQQVEYKAQATVY